MNRSTAMAVCGALLGTFATWVYATDMAEHMVAEEIVGVVVEAETGKPIPDAIVAIRFERNNTGHGGPHCFRSTAVETDAQGHFRFPPWSQDNTRANFTFGQVTAYKAGYSVFERLADMAEIHQASRTILGIHFSDTIKIPRHEVRVELKPYVGTEQNRMDQLHRLTSQFTCLWQAHNDNLPLLQMVRQEYVDMPLANIIKPGYFKTVLQGFDELIQRVRNPSDIVHAPKKRI